MKSPNVSEVVAFPARAASAERFSARDRICIANLPARLAAAGVTRVDLHTQADHGDSQFGDFLMFYAGGESWSRWGIGCSGRGFLAWRSANGETLGYFDSLGDAVAALEREATQGLGPAAGVPSPEGPSAEGPDAGSAPPRHRRSTPR